MTLNPSTPAVSLTLLPDGLSVYRFDPLTPLANVGHLSGGWSVTRTQKELSVVAEESVCLTADHVDAGWRCLYVDGPVPFDLAGVVAGHTTAVAQQCLPVFVLSTFGSDLLLLRGESLTQSLQALQEHRLPDPAAQKDGTSRLRQRQFRESFCSGTIKKGADMKKADQRAGSAGKPVTRIRSNILTVVTILVAAALVLSLVIDPLIDAALGPLIGPLIWTLAIFIAIRLLLNARRLGSSAAAPLLNSASVQSGLFGYPPGASRIEEPGAAAYTISETAYDPRENRPDERSA